MMSQVDREALSDGTKLQKKLTQFFLRLGIFLKSVTINDRGENCMFLSGSSSPPALRWILTGPESDTASIGDREWVAWSD